ncbi:nSTAND3 domain-containing NTPase [Mucilaginibacter terrae]|uniref:Novel STAND NTPase 3 domain-containing protein n=1 Tax=Mucilaginibacter terrae TaxID=1955052 RepID=A0ABU3GR59_9SPHI|nr:hypothetical protein [Mucilaginibacter terrae]MDT3402268.1 hypothetical protein [Mucilaginibacter terrae]
MERAKNGYQIYKVASIREAEDVIATDNDVKQLFYFDDFLGETYYEILTASQTESQITQFVDRIKNTPNKYLMLTTRTVILNQADDKSEKINRSQLLNQQYEIQLSDYSKFEKAEILYNHLYFYRIKENLFNCILQNKFYNTIINHKNYTPRTIESLTDPTKIENLTPAEYHEFITLSLTNPEGIWSRSFHNQINYFDQLFLITLFTFRGKVNEKALIKAYDARLQYEKVSHNQIIKANQFRDSAKILLNGFVISTLIDGENPEREYSFINPSLADFFKGFIKDSFHQKKAIISSIIYIEQLQHFDPDVASIAFESDLQFIVKERVIRDELDSIDKYKLYRMPASILQTVRKYCPDIDIDQLFMDKMAALDFNDTYWIKDAMLYCLLHPKNSEQIKKYIKNDFLNIVDFLVMAIDQPDMARKLPELFALYDQDYQRYFADDKRAESLSNMIINAANYNYRFQKSILENNALSLIEVDKTYLTIHQADINLKNSLMPDVERDIQFERQIDRAFWETKIKENDVLKQEKLKNKEKLIHYYKNSTLTAKTEEKAIDDLFYIANYTKAIQDDTAFDEPPF